MNWDIYIQLGDLELIGQHGVLRALMCEVYIFSCLCEFYFQFPPLFKDKHV